MTAALASLFALLLKAQLEVTEQRPVLNLVRACQDMDKGISPRRKVAVESAVV